MGTTNIAVCFCYENQVPARKTAFATTRVLLKCCPMHSRASQWCEFRWYCCISGVQRSCDARATAWL